MTTTKIIGPNGGADYATPALWFASFASTLTDDQVGNCQNAEIIVTAAQTLSGITPGAFTMLLTAGAGNSFVDNANKLTNALRYNASNGAAIRITSGITSLLDIEVNNFSLTRLQMKKDDSYSVAVYFNTSSGCVVDQCIIATVANNARGLQMGGGVTVKNTLVYTAGVSDGVSCSGNSDFQDLTIVTSSAGTGKTGFSQSYSVPTLANVAVAGFATDFSGTGGSCSNNATDKGSFGGTNFGTSGQVSLVPATEWQNAASGTEDYRVNSSTSVKLKGNGTATGTPTTDIVGTTRAAPPTIGAWDVGAVFVPPVPVVQVVSTNMRW